MSSVRHDVHDEAWHSQRSAAGLDLFDEVWDGVLHVVPPPSGHHQRLCTYLACALLDRATVRGFILSMETGLFDHEKGMKNFRVPDLSVYRQENASDAGIDGRAELVVELRSPRDETYEKFPFYATLEVQEVLVVHPESRRFELYRLDATGYQLIEPDNGGRVTLDALDVGLATVETDDGPRLQVTIDDITTRL